MKLDRDTDFNCMLSRNNQFSTVENGSSPFTTKLNHLYKSDDCPIG